MKVYLTTAVSPDLFCVHQMIPKHLDAGWFSGSYAVPERRDNVLGDLLGPIAPKHGSDEVVEVELTATKVAHANFCRKCFAQPAVINMQEIPMCELCANDLFDEVLEAGELGLFTDYGLVDLTERS